ncbi:sigma-70 family RNA polymerase sigma factor [Teredinibacter sp. KSP-S5-2]|uniref:sigma-70 family RNA polymerase sigma factor n=1 Tax=Teredinibacter sp. KSP-S5-2 TaxID=3034506 RepID=UPI002934CAB7|nr:sigma-70 family RNA polymerase sigma factor [Teredinibacter sp. KSP-S5-2]WNO11328.1 sigma-70 family RNA polymerase sigma factor [Teredinibacter sp. KSP-S5-2]
MQHVFQKDIHHNIDPLDEIWSITGGKISVKNRNRIFELYFPWCRQIAGSIYKNYQHYLLDWEDFLGICSVSLLESIDKYDSSMNIPFKGYAYPRMKGSILNAIRDLTKKERAFSKRKEKNDDLVNYYEKKEDDPLTIIADLTVDIALGMLIESSSDSQNSLCNYYIAAETNRKLFEIVESLPEKIRFIIKSYYYQQLSFKDIAELLNLSNARISQIHKEALKSIRRLLELKK